MRNDKSQPVPADEPGRATLAEIRAADIAGRHLPETSDASGRVTPAAHWRKAIEALQRMTAADSLAEVMAARVSCRDALAALLSEDEKSPG